MLPCKYLLMVVIRWVGCAHVHVQRKEGLQRHQVSSELQIQSNPAVEAVYLTSTMIMF